MKKLIINDSLSLEDFQAYPDTDILIISKDVILKKKTPEIILKNAE